MVAVRVRHRWVRGTVRAVAVAAVAGFVFAGCSDGGNDGDGKPDGASSADTTGTAGPSRSGQPPSGTGRPATGDQTSTFTFEQLAAALPAVDELPADYTVGQECRQASDQDCALDGGEVRQAVLMAWVQAAQSERQGDLVRISATAHPSPRAAQQATATVREQRSSQFNGPFDIPAEEAQGGEVPGRRGQGHAGDIEIDGWTGYQLTMAYTEVNLAGDVGDTVAQHGFLVLTRGNAEIDIEVRMPRGLTMDDTAQSRLDTWMRKVLDQLN